MKETTIEQQAEDFARREVGWDETKWDFSDQREFEKLKSAFLSGASLQTPSNEKDLVVYDQINGDFIEVASLEDALKYIKEVATDPEEGIHPDIESIKVYKEVADVVCEEVEGEEETYRVKVIPRQSTPIPIQTPCVEWTRVEDGLPEAVKKGFNSYMTSHVQVYILGDNDYETGVGSGRYCYERKAWFATLYNYFTPPVPNVTHWMPLPTKPNI